MDRIQTSHGDTPEEGDFSVMSSSSQQPYRDSADDERAMSQQRRDSWADEEPLGAGSTPLMHKDNSRFTFDLDFDDEYGSSKLGKRRKPWIIFGSLCALVFLIILLGLDIIIRLGRRTWPKEQDAIDEEVLCNWGESGSPTEGLAWYPTDFLRDVIPKPIHSHNDYWRKVPLFSALRQGCISVEADVWLFDDPERRDHLYVGHDQAALQPNRTFESLYIQPLVEILTRQNPTTEFYDANGRGVFDTAPNQTLTLLVDVKTAGPETWVKVVEQLEPLRERGWLSYFADGTVHTRPVTVVGTGDTPFDLLTQNTTYRDYFYDAPLKKLAEGAFDETNSYYASVSFGSAVGNLWMGSSSLSEEQLDKIRWQVSEAHARGLKARYWDLPEWPVSVRNLVWDTLIEEGVDMLNVDNIRAAARREWDH